jgi:Flp pilus assembly protein TadG
MSSLHSFRNEATPYAETVTGRSRHGLRHRVRLVADEEGVVLAEALVVIPMLVMITFGILQFSLMMFCYNSMMDAARHGAREMAVGVANETEAESTVESMLVNWPVNWSITAEDSDTTGTDEVRVTVSIPMLEAGVLSILPFSGVMTARVIMRKE